MKTVLTSDGLVVIPPEVRQADHLVAGDSFELQRLRPGQYLLAKHESKPSARFQIVQGDDNLPLIRATDGVITSALVKEFESQTQ